MLRSNVIVFYPKVGRQKEDREDRDAVVRLNSYPKEVKLLLCIFVDLIIIKKKQIY